MDAELIIILVALGLSILSGINKSKKKKSSGQTPTTTTTEPDDDPWSTIRKYIEQAQHTEEESGYEESNAKQESGRQVQSEAIQSEEENTYVARLNKYARQKQTRPAAKSRLDNRNAEPAPATKPQVEQSDLLEDFDLSKAVIYSEILKPRYDEY